MKTTNLMEFVPIESINIDSSYQRPLDESRVAKMGKAFSMGAVKAVSLSRRDDGSLWCYDGQHTLAVLKLHGCTHVHATVVPGSKKQEAQWFALMNSAGSRKATARDVQRAQVVAEDSLACLVNQLLSAHGVVVAKGGSKAGTTSAIGSIRGWANSDPVRLGNVMDAIRMMWINDEHAWCQIVMRGMWDCAGSDKFDLIVEGLVRHKVTPRRILDSASAMQAATGLPGGGSGFAKKAILKLARVSSL